MMEGLSSITPLAANRTHTTCTINRLPPLACCFYNLLLILLIRLIQTQPLRPTIHGFLSHAPLRIVQHGHQTPYHRFPVRQERAVLHFAGEGA